MYYFKVTYEFIRDLRYAWANYNRELISEINRIVDRVMEDIENEADDDLRNERYNDDSIYEWKRNEISKLMEWKTNIINKIRSDESDGNRLINKLSDMKFYENQKNNRFIFDFCDLELSVEYDEDLNGAINVTIGGVVRDGYYDVYEYKVDFDYPEMEYTDWMLDD